MRVLGIVPARGGSVGLPRKNLRVLGGVPLIVHAIRTGQACESIARTIVTTDDAEIAAVARSYGADVPFLRPASLARSESKMFDVLVHAVCELSALGDDPYDAIALLQPTSPLRAVEDVQRSIDALGASGPDSVITVYRHPQAHPRLMYTLGPDGSASPVWVGRDRMPQRQELTPVFMRCGVAYVFRRSLLVPGGDIYGRRTVAVEVPHERSCSIDDATDFTICEALAERHWPELTNVPTP